MTRWYLIWRLSGLFNTWQWPEDFRICQRCGQGKGGGPPGRTLKDSRSGAEFRVYHMSLMFLMSWRNQLPWCGWWLQGSSQQRAGEGGTTGGRAGDAVNLPWGLSFHSSLTSSPQPLLMPNEAKGEKSFCILLTVIYRNYRKSVRQ